MGKRIAGEKKEYKQRLASSPNYLMIEPTNKCNLKCRMCSREELSDIGDMSIEDFRIILDTLTEIRTVKFQGLGEAYLAKDALEMLKCCKEHNIDVVSITNCLWPDSIKAEEVMPFLKHIYISYHAADKETYHQIVGRGSWKKLHATIKEIVKYKGNCDVIFNCVLSNLNYHQAPLIVEHAHKMGVDFVRFQIMQNWTAKDEELHDELADIQNMDMDELIEIIRNTYKKGQELGVTVNLVGNEEFDYTHCIWPFERTYINKNGDVLPCHMRPNPRYSVGNIHKQSFSEIWNGDTLNLMRELLSQNEAPEMCKECPYISAAEEIKVIKGRLGNL